MLVDILFCVITDKCTVYCSIYGKSLDICNSVCEFDSLLFGGYLRFVTRSMCIYILQCSVLLNNGCDVNLSFLIV